MRDQKSRYHWDKRHKKYVKIHSDQNETVKASGKRVIK